MAYLPTGAQARERAQNNNVIAQQIAIQAVQMMELLPRLLMVAQLQMHLYQEIQLQYLDRP